MFLLFLSSAAIIHYPQCAPSGEMVRTICCFAAHHFMFWCAPFHLLLRTVKENAAQHFVFCCPAFYPVVRKRFSSSPEFEFENGGASMWPDPLAIRIRVEGKGEIDLLARLHRGRLLNHEILEILEKRCRRLRRLGKFRV